MSGNEEDEVILCQTGFFFKIKIRRICQKKIDIYVNSIDMLINISIDSN